MLLKTTLAVLAWVAGRIWRPIALTLFGIMLYASGAMLMWRFGSDVAVYGNGSLVVTGTIKPTFLNFWQSLSYVPEAWANIIFTFLFLTWPLWWVVKKVSPAAGSNTVSLRRAIIHATTAAK